MQNSNAPYSERDSGRQDYRNRRRQIPYRSSEMPTRPQPAPRKRKRHQMYSRILKGSRSMPSIFKRGNIFFVVENERGQYRLPRNLILSMVVVFICALSIVITHAQVNGVAQQVAGSNRQLINLQYENLALGTQIGVHYTSDQIQYIAFTQLGMNFPDASQIIEINVPRRSHVILNTSEDVLPRENYFWLDLRNFAASIFDRVFGG